MPPFIDVLRVAARVCMDASCACHTQTHNPHIAPHMCMHLTKFCRERERVQSNVFNCTARLTFVSSTCWFAQNVKCKRCSSKKKGIHTKAYLCSLTEYMIPIFSLKSAVKNNNPEKNMTHNREQILMGGRGWFGAVLMHGGIK